MTSLKDRLAELGHTLPALGTPAANYLHHREGDGLLVIAGQIGTPGRGAGLDVDAGRVRQVLRLGVFIAAGPGFMQHSTVADGASDLVVAAFGDRGRHARAAVGVASLPAGAAVEVEALVQVAP